MLYGSGFCGSRVTRELILGTIQRVPFVGFYCYQTYPLETLHLLRSTTARTDRTMAEQVQAALDEMVAPLQDLQERNVFSLSEIHAIVDRRRSSEYLLRRRNVRQSDFLQYINDEGQLEKLRKLRTLRLQRKERQQDLPIAKHIGDKHVVQHIHSLWTRTLRKFRSDQALYMQYASYLKESLAHRKLQALYSSALQIFPKCPVWWIEAASHEYFAASSVANARILLQRGLRMNAKSQDLWLQSFTLELHVVQKMQGRRQILLGMDSISKEGDDDDDRYKIAALVHDNAMKAVPNDVSFRTQFWKTCLHFPATDALKQRVLDSMQRDCGESVAAWIAAADCTIQEQHGVECIIGFLKPYEEEEDESQPKKKRRTVESTDTVATLMHLATRSIPTEEMYLQAVRLLVRYQQQQRVPDDVDRQEKIAYIDLVLDKLFHEASDLKVCSTPLLLEQVYYYLRNDKPNSAISLLEQSAKDGSADSAIWMRWASLVSFNRAVVILNQALTKIPMGSANHLPVLLQLLGAKMAVKKPRQEDLWILFERILLLAPGCVDQNEIVDPVFGVANVADACLQLLLYAISTKDTTFVQRVYQSVMFQSSLTKIISESDQDTFRAFVDASIDAEKSLFFPPKRKRLSRLFDAAIAMFAGTCHADLYRKRRDDEVVYG
jgi:tetratricopeptide (TPR) repeat protein